MTNAAWVKTGATAALTQTGIDGIANSASLLTATAANGTSLQTITLVSAAYFQSIYIKRITGSGVIQMTMDNVTWTTVTITSGWTRVTIPTQTIANPIVGIRIATSGDAVAVTASQLEGIPNGGGASSVITTSTAAVTRAADNSCTLANTKFNLAASTHTLYAKGSMAALSTNNTDQYVIAVSDGTASNFARLDLFNGTNGALNVNSGGILQAGASVPGAVANTMYKINAGIAAGNFNLSRNGILGTLVATGTVPVVTELEIGTSPGYGLINGWVQEILYVPRRMTDAELIARST